MFFNPSLDNKAGALLTRDNVTRNEKTDYISLAGQTFVRIKNGVATYPLNDHLGTAMMEADQNGSVPANQVYNYTPWGEIFNVVPFGTPGNDPGNRNEQGFTGHIDDMSGLVYMQARYYDPVIGRFLSTDPIGYADQLNLYAYVHNDPINGIDPFGKQCRAMEDVSGSTCDYTGNKPAPPTPAPNTPSQVTQIQENYAWVEPATLLVETVNDALITTAVAATTVSPSGWLAKIGAWLSRGEKVGAVAELFNFSTKASKHMDNPGRAVTVQILQEAIKSTKGMPDPRGSSALMHTAPMVRNGKDYNLEVLFNAETNSIWHFQYYPLP